jgi:hypothetical protein
MDAEGKFYLGRFFDVKTRKVNLDPLLYSLEDLTTKMIQGEAVERKRLLPGRLQELLPIG